MWPAISRTLSCPPDRTARSIRPSLGGGTSFSQGGQGAAARAVIELAEQVTAEERAAGRGLTSVADLPSPPC